MRIVIGTHVELWGLPESERGRWMRAASWENPKYEASARYMRSGKPDRRIPQRIELWQQTSARLILPRGLLADVRVAYPDADVLDNRAMPAATVRTRGTLVPRDYQREAIDAVVSAGGGVVVAGTGTGKTVIALGLIERLRVPTLILTHTGTLQAQAVERVRDLLGIEPGQIGGGKWSPAWVTVGTLQTFASRGPGELRDAFGLVVVDECHHVPAETFARVASMFLARYRVGLTATPKRTDKLECILFAVLGPIVWQRAGSSLPLRFEGVQTGWTCDDLPRRKVRSRKAPFALDGTTERKDDLDYVALISRLCEDKTRTDLILRTIDREHWGTSLALTERVDHAREIAAGLRTRGLAAVALTGEDDEATRARAVAGLADGTVRVLVSTPGLVGEGFDCPRIDTLFVCAPHGLETKAEQTAGRTTRPYPGKTHGRVVDFVDAAVEPLARQWQKRARVYKRLAGGPR